MANSLDATFSKRAQKFTTGSNFDGYTLNSIGFLFHTISNTSTAGSHLTVSLNEVESSGHPGTALCTLRELSTFPSSGVYTFDAPKTGTNLSPTLDPETTYIAVIKRVVLTSDTIFLKSTTSFNDDPNRAAGWTVANDRLVFTDHWFKAGASVLRIVVKGTDNPAVAANFEQETHSVAEGGTVEVVVRLSAEPERLVTIPLPTTNQGGATGANPYGYRLSHVGVGLEIPDTLTAGASCQAMPARSVREEEMVALASVTSGVTTNHLSLDRTRPLPSGAVGQKCTRRKRTL